MSVIEFYLAAIRVHVARAAKAYVAAMIPIVATIILGVTDVADVDVKAAGMTVLAATVQWAGVYYTANYKPMLEDLADEAD